MWEPLRRHPVRTLFWPVFVALAFATGLFIGDVGASNRFAPEGPVLVGPSYDANDAIYQFIPVPPDNWVDQFGDNERSRVLHSLSELRIVLGTMGRTMITMQTELQELRALLGDPEVDE